MKRVNLNIMKFLVALVTMVITNQIFASSSNSKLCQKYKNSYVGYYGNIFYIDQSCKRYELSSEEFNKLNKNQDKKIKITEVDSEVISTLKLSGKYQFKEEATSTCKKYKNKYITTNLDVYYIDKKCRKRPFLDWASYENHRGKLDSKNQVVYVTGEELDSFKEGEPMESVLDRYFRDQLKRQQLDILSNEEACKGLVGKYVIYTDKIYYIQRGKKSDSIACEKRLVDGEDFTKLNINFKFNVELTTSQALSIPDGKKKEAVKLKR